jgi:hypothetical protein
MSLTTSGRFALLALTALFASLALLPRLRSQEPDGTWTANADLEKAQRLTMDGLGAMQGVNFYDGKVYLYGDVWDANPRLGVIREYTADYKPTGRVVWLRQADKPMLRHPMGRRLLRYMQQQCPPRPRFSALLCCYRATMPTFT